MPAFLDVHLEEAAQVVEGRRGVAQEALLLELASAHAALVTIEDNAIAGGAGSAVAEVLNLHGVEAPLLQLGLSDRFLEHASREELLASDGLDPAGIEASVRRRFGAVLATPALRNAI